MQRNLLLTLTLLCLAVYSSANPAIVREFHRVVNSNQCLKECMRPVQESNMELSVFKRANYADYFLNLDTICELITATRHCIDNCQVDSNPFALISMNAICSEKSRQEAELLKPCLANVGTQVHAQCVQVCGDYEQLNDQLHVSTSTLKPEDQSALQTINGQTNEACAVLKCSARCAVDNFNQQCGHLPNGQLAGNLIRDIVDRILSTHQMDLQVFGLLKLMQKNTQPECNYIHTPAVLFNPLKDIISQRMLRASQKAVEPVVEVPQQQAQVPQQANAEQEMRVEATQLYVRFLKKQMQVLDKQMELMDKQEYKLDTETPRFMQSAQPVSNEMF